MAGERRNVDVASSVVIEIADGSTQGVHFNVQAAAGGDVAERAVVIVAVKRAERFPATRGPVFAIDQQNVGPAVAIGVEKRAARAERFRKKLLPCPSAVVRKVDASRAGDVRQLNG